jgi:hypothetical protein
MRVFLPRSDLSGHSFGTANIASIRITNITIEITQIAVAESPNNAFSSDSCLFPNLLYFGKIHQFGQASLSA